MFFASPVIRRAAFANPRAADLALQRFLQGTLATSQAGGVQVERSEQATQLQLDLPGLAREQLSIEIEGAVVRLRSAEGAPRQVQRAWELDHEIDASASTAKLEHGVLTLSLAKLAPQNRATALAIQ